MRTTRRLLNFFVVNLVHVTDALVTNLAERLRPECRHVLMRQGVLQGEAEITLYVRCLEPSALGCEMAYCPRHCDELCGHEGDDGGEDEIDPDVWEPQVGGDGRPKVEA